MSKACTKCGGRMEQGFIPEAIGESRKISRWVEGAPEQSLWTGIKTGGRKQFELEAWRCGGCGLVEIYAPQ